MSVKSELKKLVTACGGTPTGNTIPKLLGEIAVALGGESTGKTVAEQIANIVAAKTDDSQPEPEPVVKYTVTYNSNGGAGIIEPVEVVAGESITVDDGSGLTPPEHETPEFSYEFAGWAKTSSAQSATVVSPFTPDKDTTLYAVWVEHSPME